MKTLKIALLPLALLAHAACGTAAAAVPADATPSASALQATPEVGLQRTIGPNDANGFYGVAPPDPTDIHLFALTGLDTVGKTLYATLVPDDPNRSMQQQARMISGAASLSWYAPLDQGITSTTWTLYAYVDSNGDGQCNEAVYTQSIDLSKQDTPTGHRIFLSDLQAAPASACDHFAPDTTDHTTFTVNVVPSAKDVGSLVIFYLTDTTTGQQLSGQGQQYFGGGLRNLVGGHSYDITTYNKSATPFDVYHLDTVWSDQIISY